MHTADEVQTHCCLFLRMRMASKRICCCVKMTKKDRFMMDAAEDIEPEFQVAHIIKQMRVMKGLIKEKMSDEPWKEGYQKYSLF